MESSPVRSTTRGAALEVESKLKDRRGKARATARTEAGRANEISNDEVERSLIEAAQRDPAASPNSMKIISNACMHSSRAA